MIHMWFRVFVYPCDGDGMSYLDVIASDGNAALAYVMQEGFELFEIYNHISLGTEETYREYCFYHEFDYRALHRKAKALVASVTKANNSGLRVANQAYRNGESYGQIALPF
jgi:hypothetical protein